MTYQNNMSVYDPNADMSEYDPNADESLNQSIDPSVVPVDQNQLQSVPLPMSYGVPPVEQTPQPSPDDIANMFNRNKVATGKVANKKPIQKVDDLEKLQKQREKVLFKEAEIEADTNLALGMINEDRKKIMQENIIEQQRIKERFDASLQKWEQDDANARAELDAHKEDPQRFFKERGAAATVFGAISTALGALGSSILGGPNQGQANIDRIIDRDIAAQRQEYAIKKDKVDRSKNQYAMLKDRNLSEQAISSMMREQRLEYIGEEARRIALESGSEKAKVNAEKLASDLSMRVEQLRYDRKQDAIKNSQNWAQIDAARQRANAPQAGEKLSKLVVTLPDGTEKFANTDKDAQEAKEMIDGTQSLTTAANQLKKSIQEDNILSSKTRKHRVNLVNKMTLAIKKKEALGQLSASDMELAKVIDDPNAVFTSDDSMVELLDTAIQDANIQAVDYLKRRGVDILGKK